MSDLKDRRPDQDDRPKPRFGPGNRLGLDREPGTPDLDFNPVSSRALGLLAIGLFCASCVSTPPPVLRASEVHRREVWVDAFSPQGGDGSSARPFKRVPQPIAADVAMHLRAGLYAGPFVLEPGAVLTGHGAVVLTGEAGQTVVTARGATLRDVAVQGGAIGLRAGEQVVLDRVHFSGQRRQAALVQGQLTISDATLEASVEGIDGVVVDRGATLMLHRAKFTGGFRRAVTTEGGALELDALTGEGPRTLVHAIDATSRVTNVHAVLGSGPALFFAGGKVIVEKAELVGHEFSVMLSRGVEAQLSQVQARGALQACIAAVGASLTLSRSVLTKCGSGGALTLQASKTTLKDVTLESSRELGVFVKQGTLTLDTVKVSGVAAAPDGSLGDAFHVRDEAQVSATGPVSVFEVDGSGLFASSFCQVALSALSVERARSSALFVERGAQVSLEALLVRGGRGPAIVVPGQASVEVKSLWVSGGNEMPVYAECSAGASVRVGRLESTVQQLPSRCVTVN